MHAPIPPRGLGSYTGAAPSGQVTPCPAAGVHTPDRSASRPLHRRSPISEKPSVSAGCDAVHAVEVPPRQASPAGSEERGRECASSPSALTMHRLLSRADRGVSAGASPGAAPSPRRSSLIRQAVRLALVICVVGTYFLAAPFGYGAFMLLHRFRAKDAKKRARLLQGIMRRAFTLMHDTLRLVGRLDVNPRQLHGTLPPGPAVLVANHPTLCDVTSTIAAFEDVTTAVKPQIFRRHWLRSLLEDARFFEGAGGPFDSAAVVASGVERIREGFR